MSVLVEQLRISDKGTRLHLDFHINKSAMFKDVYLDSIVIMTADKVSETYPDIPTEDFIFKADFPDYVKCCHMVLDIEGINSAFLNWNPLEEQPVCADKPYGRVSFDRKDFSRNLFFVYIKIKGTPGQCTPCRLDEEITVLVTFDEKLLYQRAMGYINELAEDCRIPVGFSDFILLWNAFKAAIETEHFVQALKFWKLLFDINTGAQGFGRVMAKGCGCHG